MKKVILILTFFTAIQTKGQTSIAGGSVNGVWSLAGSPYNVNGSIFIPNGDSLKIQHGVTVNFLGTYKLLVSGKLKAIGTVTDTIVFTASNTTAGWRGIRFALTPATNDSSVIRYCKIKYGKATGLSPDDNGGAIYFDSFSKAKVSNCLIAGCMANNLGGAIYCNYSSPIIDSNTIKNNSAQGGGGLYSSMSNPIISNNVINSNTVTSNGGGLCNMGGSPTISYNTISGNISTYFAGGIRASCSGRILFNTINGNVAPGSGGGIFAQPSLSDSLSVLSNTISSNSAMEGGGIWAGAASTINANVVNNNSATSNGNYGGGGILISGNGPCVVTNNFITNNNSSNYGGALSFVGVGHFVSNNVICNNEAVNGGAIYTSTNVSSTFVNNTFANNRAINGGAICGSNSATLALKNCIFWNDSAAFGNEVFLADEGTDPSFVYCNIKGGSGAFGLNGNFYTGTYTNNINLDPAFVASSAGTGTVYSGLSANWSLQPTSPCVDAGDPAGPYPSTDIAGNNRISGAFVDIGAYEGGTASGVFLRGENANFNIFPNPCKGQFSVSGLKNKACAIEVFNLQGQKVLEKNDNEKDQCIIDVTGLKAGVYIIRIGSENGSRFKKILID